MAPGPWPLALGGSLLRIHCNLGAQTFKDALYIEKGLNVPYNKVLKAIHEYDELIMSQQRKIKIKRRSYHASSVHESLEIDIAEMPYEPNYFLCGVNVFNRMIYAIPCTSTSKEKVIPAIKKIIKKTGNFQRVTADAGFKDYREIFLKMGTHLNIKVRKTFAHCKYFQLRLWWLRCLQCAIKL